MSAIGVVVTVFHLDASLIEIESVVELMRYGGGQEKRMRIVVGPFAWTTQAILGVIGAVGEVEMDVGVS